MTFEPTPEVLEAVAQAIHEKLAPFEVFGEDTSNVKFARETAAHVIAAYEAAQWQPIESAPRDGSEFIAWAQDPHVEKRGYYGVAQWAEANGMPRAVSGWFWAYAIRPTHWRPPPPPPA